MQVDIHLLTTHDWLITCVVLFVALFSKFLGCQMTTSFANLFIKNKSRKWKLLETYIFAASMATRGEVALVLSTILRGAHIINSTQYIICVTVIVLTAILSPILLSIGFKQYDKKQIESDEEYSVRIGPFAYISSRYLFDIVSSHLEKTHKLKPIISLIEGNKILTAGSNIKIILESQKGIVFIGKKHKIKKILESLKNSLSNDVDKIPGKIL